MTPVCLGQEQKQLLRAGQQWRVQLEREDSQRHVQVVQGGEAALGGEDRKQCKPKSVVPPRSMMMTACDLGAVTKPWDISRKVRGRDAARGARGQTPGVTHALVFCNFRWRSW